MINFDELTFKRAAAHQILEKVEGMETATILESNSMLQLNNKVIETMKERLKKAASQNSKSFELEVEDTLESSFYGLTKRMKNAGDEDFLSKSADIARILAESQKSSNIPGGWLIIVEATTQIGSYVYIALKAEMHEALRFESSNIEYLNDVFLSPTQKLYKAGIIYERKSEELEYPHSHYGCMLLDNQFRIDSKPAEYFYKDFLGFSVENNPKIQSKRFYEATENFIMNSIDNLDQKNTMLDALHAEFQIDPDKETMEIDPLIFGSQNFEDTDVLESYAADVANYLPQSIYPDDTLIRGKLDWRKINFPNKVKISGPVKTFDLDIQIVDSLNELQSLDFQHPNFTIVKILGRPFQKI